MYSPKKQQIEICLLKYSLEEIEHNLIEQRSAIPALDAENEKKYRETMTELRTARSLNDETERLKQESVRLTARRMHLKRQSDDVTTALQAARDRRNSLEQATRKEEHEMELQIRRYEDTLRDIADRFRNTPVFYNEDDINNEMEVIRAFIVKLENDKLKRQNEFAELKNKLETLQADIPDNILNILGKTELENKLKEISQQIETLRSERDNLSKSRSYTSVINRSY